MLAVVMILVLLCAVPVAFLLWFRRLSARNAGLPVTTDWIEELDVGRYGPTFRLLDASEIRSLRSQPGFTVRMASELRAQRCHMCRDYVRKLAADFQLVCSALKLLIAQSRDDRPDLAARLLQHQVTFACSLVAVQLRIALYRWGLGSVELSALYAPFEAMRLELRALVPASQGVA